MRLAAALLRLVAAEQAHHLVVGREHDLLVDQRRDLRDRLQPLDDRCRGRRSRRPASPGRSAGAPRRGTRGCTWPVTLRSADSIALPHRSRKVGGVAARRTRAGRTRSCRPRAAVELEGGGDAEVGAGAAHRPEQVGAPRSGVVRTTRAVGEDDVDRAQVVDGQPCSRANQPIPPAVASPPDAHAAVVAAADREPVRRERASHVGPPGPGSEPHPTGRRASSTSTVSSAPTSMTSPPWFSERPEMPWPALRTPSGRSRCSRANGDRVLHLARRSAAAGRARGRRRAGSWRCSGAYAGSPGSTARRPARRGRSSYPMPGSPARQRDRAADPAALAHVRAPRARRTRSRTGRSRRGRSAAASPGSSPITMKVLTPSSSASRTSSSAPASRRDVEQPRDLARGPGRRPCAASSIIAMPRSQVPGLQVGHRRQPAVGRAADQAQHARLERAEPDRRSRARAPGRAWRRGRGGARRRPQRTARSAVSQMPRITSIASSSASTPAPGVSRVPPIRLDRVPEPAGAQAERRPGHPRAGRGSPPTAPARPAGAAAG